MIKHRDDSYKENKLRRQSKPTAVCSRELQTDMSLFSNLQHVCNTTYPNKQMQSVAVSVTGISGVQFM
jgi:hypothetical protein